MILRKGTVATDTAPSNYPAPYALPEGLMRWLPLSDAGGLSQFGAAVETLDPGGQSSQRHWHEAEDEFLYVLDGELTVVENDGDHILTPGDAACWPAGVANGHCLINRSQRPATYLIVGTRAKDDAAHYPDINLHYSRKDGQRSMSHKDGTPYPGWPKETNR
ncbi:cupin domain-containing protein [Frigidibacter sp. RF13]|uniref:cupin domain-containing protein n=1 Tax=Frigidibacter sp. RF13 TaxID=2997340 RepID=UPI00226DDC72|nr:cupin domain-containing protein [Frigidibacter sp. RF13]MCY1126145.1 cupin domain-containing protein [Frigidibacter sp. RF13]